MFESKRQKMFSSVVFVVYIVLLCWLILFKFSTNIRELSHIRNINLIPFHESMIVNGTVSNKEIIYNVLVFVPFGVMLSIFMEKWSFVKMVLVCLGTSLVFEVLQFIFAIGASDITDVINNTLGGILGILLAIVFRKVFKQKMIRIVNTVGIIVELAACSLLIVLHMV